MINSTPWQVAAEGLPKEKEVVVIQDTSTHIIPERVDVAYRSHNLPGMPSGDYWVIFNPQCPVTGQCNQILAKDSFFGVNIAIKEIRSTDLWKPLPLPEGYFDISCC